MTSIEVLERFARAPRPTVISILLTVCVLIGWQHVSSKLEADQQALKASAKLMSVLDEGHTSVLMADGEGVVTHYNANAAKLIGGIPAGQSLTDLLAMQRQRDLSAVVASAQLSSTSKVVLSKTVWHDQELLVTIWVAAGDQGDAAVAMTLLPIEQAEVRDDANQNQRAAAPVARTERR